MFGGWWAGTSEVLAYQAVFWCIAFIFGIGSAQNRSSTEFRFGQDKVGHES